MKYKKIDGKLQVIEYVTDILYIDSKKAKPITVEDVETVCHAKSLNVLILNSIVNDINNLLSQILKSTLCSS